MMDRSLRAPHALVGRAAELEAVRRLVDGAMDGPATLMLEGEAGIGKTTLWSAGAALAARSGFRVLSCRPAEAEARLSYAALVDLLEGAVDEPLDDLPDVQRRALDVALLRAEADGSVDPRTVGAAVLGVLRALASTSPVLIAVDDEQWLDPASAGAIGFAIRRLSEEPVAVIAASRVREGTSDPMGLLRAMPKERLERVRVVAFGPDEVAELLRQRIAFEPAIATLRRIHGVSRGNPFFALELGRALQASGGDVSADGQLPVPEDLRDLLRVRLHGLPASTADVLLLASSMSNATLSLVEAAAGDPDSAAEDLAVAARVGIVEVFGDEARTSRDRPPASPPACRLEEWSRPGRARPRRQPDSSA